MGLAKDQFAGCLSPRCAYCRRPQLQPVSWQPNRSLRGSTPDAADRIRQV